ncbi:MAG TPA: tetratricopeptide repeat protein, partial [Brevundimonas sp.]
TLRTYLETDTSFPARYARAIAWYRDGQTQRALDATEALIAEDIDNPYLWELKGQILFEDGRPADSLEAHRKSIELKPDAPLLRINLAHALIETNDATNLDPAIDQLKRAVAREPDNTLAWRLLSQAYATQGKEGQARLASAEYWFAAGDTDQATQFALRARPMLDRNSIEWRRAVDIVLASGATDQDIQDLDQRQQRNRGPIVEPASAATIPATASPAS